MAIHFLCLFLIDWFGLGIFLLLSLCEFFIFCILTFIIYLICKYFLPLSRLLFHFTDSFLCWAEAV